jgi:hypothetical protein
VPPFLRKALYLPAAVGSKVFAGTTFANGRRLREFQEWLRWNRQFDLLLPAGILVFAAMTLLERAGGERRLSASSAFSARFRIRRWCDACLADSCGD